MYLSHFVFVHSQLMEMNRNGPLALTNHTSVCAEGRTGQWECVRENTIYKTSGYWCV